MLLTEIGFELVEHLERQTDIPSLLASFQRLVLAHGMDCFCIGDPTHPEVLRDDRRWGATWPVSWYWRYISQNHLSRDPIIARLNLSPAPFRWSDTYALANRSGRRVLDEAAEFGLKDGLALAVHGDGVLGGVSIGTRHYELSPRERAGLQLAAYYLHARVAALRAGGRRAHRAFWRRASANVSTGWRPERPTGKLHRFSTSPSRRRTVMCRMRSASWGRARGRRRWRWRCSPPRFRSEQ